MLILTLVGAVILIIIANFMLVTKPIGVSSLYPIFLGVGGVMILGFGLLTVWSQSSVKLNLNQDPRVGIVEIKGLDGMIKKCDGSTLVYIGNGTSNIVVDSSDCK